MPYCANPTTLQPTRQALALVAQWQAEQRTQRLPPRDELARWWIAQRWTQTSSGSLRSTLAGGRWRQLGRHVHAWTYIHARNLIDSVGMDLGIENDWIPAPTGLDFDSETGELRCSHWNGATHAFVRPGFPLQTWVPPLACLRYIRPAWRDEPMRRLPPEKARLVDRYWWV